MIHHVECWLTERFDLEAISTHRRPLTVVTMRTALKRLAPTFLPCAAASTHFHQQTSYNRPLPFHGFKPVQGHPPSTYGLLNKMPRTLFASTTWCMEEPEPPSDETIHSTLTGMYKDIPDPSIITVRQFREMTSDKLGLGPDGLDDRRDVVQRLMESIINDEMPTFNREGARVEPPLVADPVPMTFQRALVATNGLIMRKLPKPRFIPYYEPTIHICDLTLKDFYGKNAVKAVVDVVLNHHGAFTEDDVKRLMMEDDLGNLPDVARPPVGAVPVNHFTQIAFIAVGRGVWTVLKYITFCSDSPDGKVKADLAATYRHGELHLVNYGNNIKNGKKVFQHLFQELGGFQIRQFELQCSNAPAFDMNDDSELQAIDRGFDYIEQCWKDRTLPTGFNQLRWITRNLKDANSPLYCQGDFKWTDKIVEKAINKLRDEGSLVRVVTNCPYTIKTFAPWFVDNVLVDLVPLLNSKSIIFIGKAGCGKTPILEGLANAFSRYWMRQKHIKATACFRSASDLDFFRGEVGVVDRPDILDDADPTTITPAKFKAFTDVGLFEAMTRERWGASKWVRNQLRGGGFNPIDATAEPNHDNKQITHEQFLALVHPIWHKNFDLESKIAILKRSCFVAITKDWVYWRPATEQAVPVSRLRFADHGANGGKLVDPRAGPVVGAWRDGIVELPEDHDEQLAIEETWMNAAMSKGTVPIPRLMPVKAPRVVDAVSASPLRTAVSQDSQADADRIIPSSTGDYHFHVPVVNRGATVHSRFQFKASGSSCSLESLRLSTAASSMNVPLQQDASALPSSSTSPSSGQAPPPKRVKKEPGVIASSSQRAEKVERIAELKRQLEEEQYALDAAPSSPPVKDEPRSDEFGSPFRAIVSAFADETKEKPMAIDDSP